MYQIEKNMRKKRNRNQKSIVASVSPTVDDGKSKQSSTETKKPTRRRRRGPSIAQAPTEEVLVSSE